MVPPPIFAPAPSPSPTRTGGTGGPAGYGRSCTNCSRAKAKCIVKYPDASCVRCDRLGKECLPIVALRKRAPKKSPSSRTAKLEEKLDDLVSILRGTQQPQPPPSNAVAQDPYPQQPLEQSHNMPSRLDSLATAATASASTPTNMLHAAQFPSSAPMFDAAADDAPEPTPAEAEVYLDKFRGWLERFPFMYLPPEVTAASLRRERPFLWLCIMNVTSMSVPQMQRIKVTVRREVAQRVVMDHEPSMDILLGLLAYLGWASMISGPDSKPFLVLYTQLATSVLHELSLARSPIEEQYFHNCFKIWGGRPPAPKIRTLEERRALLATWYCTSVHASFIGKMDTLRWTSHIDESIEILEREKESPFDVILTNLVKVQQITDDAHHLLVRDLLGGGPNVAPSCLFRTSMLSRLNTLKDSMPSNVAAHYVIRLHIHFCEVQIHSTGLYSQSLTDTPYGVDAQRIDSMYGCVRSIRGWHDLFFSLPINELPGLPFSCFIHLFQCQVSLYRLATTEDPAWDKDMMRHTVDLLEFLDQAHDRFQQLNQVYVLKTGPGDETLWQKGCKIMRNIKAMWEPALASAALGGLPTPSSQGFSGLGSGSVAGMPVPGPVHNSGAAAAMGGDKNPLLPENGPMDFNDMAWMTDVFGPWDFLKSNESGGKTS
ncbi:unnamed protein product [Clonostachys byssicola]|uniref:Zn(2)-C6 fungal-type domain-containing protein n=1 Tax=Clonostachys byssicola TaxID=160290 RepID=A0A9N9UG41_9HYPO|nr:unnamed protein product [Clonostachys byssicola]